MKAATSQVRNARSHASLLRFDQASRLQPRRCMHESTPKPANPIPFMTRAGPPPGPPKPTPSSASELVERKKKQQELIKIGRELRANPAKPATTLQKRFWKNVDIKEAPEGLQIFLDSRPVRTASKDILTVPRTKPHLAMAIALEWDHLINARQATKQQYIPLTSLTSRAIDIAIADGESPEGNKTRDGIMEMLMGYLRTDTLLCWAPAKSRYDSQAPVPESDLPQEKTLQDTQREVAEPIIAYLTGRVWPGITLRPALDDNSIMPAHQPEESQQVISSWIKSLPAWELAGLERAVLATKSLCIGVRLLVEWSGEFKHARTKDSTQKRFAADDAANACSQEVLWQTRMWGEVEDTHDVEKEDLRRQLGSAVLLVHDQ